MCERWVGDWTNCNRLTPSSFVFSSTSFSFCWAAQSGFLRAHSPLLDAGSLYRILSPTNWLQLTELPVAPDYIIVWRSPASCERRICTQLNRSTFKVIPWYLRPDAPVPWLTAWSKVNMLHNSNQLCSANKTDLMLHPAHDREWVITCIKIHTSPFHVSYTWLHGIKKVKRDNKWDWHHQVTVIACYKA